MACTTVTFVEQVGHAIEDEALLARARQLLAAIVLARIVDEVVLVHHQLYGRG